MTALLEVAGVGTAPAGVDRTTGKVGLDITGEGTLYGQYMAGTDALPSSYLPVPLAAIVSRCFFLKLVVYS